MLKKWFCILLALGFSFTNVYAASEEEDDDEYYEDEEDEEILPAKKLDTKKAKKAAPGNTRVGLSAGFDGSPVIGLVYDMGSGIELGLGFGLNRLQYTQTRGDEEGAVSLQEWKIVLDFSYALGKGLLDYGIGAQGIILSSTFRNEDGAMDKGIFPYFYTSAELLKNVSLFLKAGALVNLLADGTNDGNSYTTTGNMNINFQSSVGLTFYFM